MVIIFDGEFLFRRQLSPKHYSHIVKNGELILDSIETELEFTRKFFRDLNKYVRKLNMCGVEKIFFTCEPTVSWRKPFMDAFNKKYNIESKGYKGKRVKDSKINWGRYIEIKEKIISHLHLFGVNLLSLKHAEGDDLVYLFSSLYLSRKKDVGIIASDMDLTMCVKSVGKNTVFHYDPNNDRLTLPINLTNIQLDTSEITAETFYDYDDSIEKITDIKNITSNPIVYVNPTDIITTKVFVTDVGDNIKGAIRGFGIKTFQKMLANYKSDEILEAINTKNIPMLNEMIGSVSKKIVDEMTVKRMIFNHRITYLHKSMIPKSILSEFIHKYLNAEFLTPQLRSIQSWKDVLKQLDDYKDTDIHLDEIEDNSIIDNYHNLINNEIK